MLTRTSLFLIAAVMVLSATAEEQRIQVDLPPMMQEHMMGNMRDHLVTLQMITQLLASQQYDQAADAAEQRLGMSSLELHGASHLGKFIPEAMNAIGTKMHHAASRFAITARNAAVDGGLEMAFGALSEVMQQCVACHAGYKVHK
ncbi:MAG: hypothetical protein OQK68_04100 [Sedimenticola sp.]|nr:hypothetical protein [Sedimenticola sp.]